MHVCMHVYMYTCMCVCMYVYMYVCMYVCMSLYLSFYLSIHLSNNYNNNFLFPCLAPLRTNTMILCLYKRFAIKRIGPLSNWLHLGQMISWKINHQSRFPFFSSCMSVRFATLVFHQPTDVAGMLNDEVKRVLGPGEKVLSVEGQR